MMAVEDAMNEVEQLEFAVRVGVANSFRAFLRNVSEEEPVKELLAQSAANDVGLKILQRVLSLTKLRVDFRYLHRFDIAIATYLWVLARSFPDLARGAAEATANLPRVWWTEQVGNYILRDWSRKSTSVTNTSLIPPSFTNFSTSNTTASTAVFLPESPAVFGGAVVSRIAGGESGEASYVINQDHHELSYATGKVRDIRADEND
jgi:hypothetical protein